MPATAEGKRPIPTSKSKSKSEPGATWQPTADEKTDLAAIDAAVDRIRSLTAPDPYVLTIPQDVEPRYHHSLRSQAQQWLHNTPFSPNEHESLQYQTFHFYEHGKQMYVQQNSRPAEPKAPISESRPHNPGTGANTPTPGPKKKISLDAYKKKQSGGPPTPDPASVIKGGDATAAKQAALKGPIERVKAESEEMLAAVAESEDSQPPTTKSEPLADRKDLKRKWEEKGAVKKDETPLKTDKHSEAHVKAEEPATKKPRRNPSPVRNNAKSSKTLPPAVKESAVQPKEEYDETKLPPRLSPGLPPRLSPLRQPRSPKPSQDDAAPPLPRMLSPTMPENIISTLKARDLYHSGSKDEKAARKAEEAAKRRSPVPRNGFRANSSSPAVRSDAEDRLRPIPSSTSKRPPSPGLSQDEDVDESSKSKRDKSPGLVIKLKYKKAQKEGIVRILKTRQTPSKRPPSPLPPAKATKEHKPEEKPPERRNGERKDEKTGKTVAQKTTMHAKKEGKVSQQDSHPATASEKRALPDDDRTAPVAKRRELNTLDSRKEPSTPARSGLPSPVATSSIQKGQFPPTPNNRKDVLSQSMKREFSQESFTMQTPPGTSATPNVNGNTSHANGAKRPHRTAQQLAWETEQKRLEVLGRELKHKASACAINESDSSSEQQKKAAVLSLESLLCYFLAFTCADEAALSADPKQHPSIRPWRSMQGLYGFVKRRCEVSPLLSGFASALGASLNAHIVGLITHSSHVESMDTELLVQATRHMQRAALEADAAFHHDLIAEQLAGAWDARSREPLSSAPETAVPARLLSGPWKLPIGVTTPPFRAARAGCAVLREWMSHERLEHTLQLGSERSSP